MFLNTRFSVLVLIIVFALCKALKSHNLAIIRPSKSEIVVDEGDTVEIICSSDDMKIYFMYPNISVFWDEDRLPKIKHIRKNVDVYEHIFQRPSTVFEDTGWYGCCRTDVLFYDHHYYDNHPYKKWIYVYVKSRTHFFLNEKPYVLNAVVGDDTAIPCRTTSPELVPTLYGNRKKWMYREKDEKIEKLFNPRIGFMMKNLKVKDTDFYRCSIEKDDIKQDIYYILYVQKQILYQPKIDESSFYETLGKDLNLRCTVQTDISMLRMKYTDLLKVFNWIIPQQNSKRIKTIYISRTVDDKNVEYTCQLTIFNVTNEDAGEYACFIESPAPFYSMRKTMRNVTIHDIRKKYINLTSEYSTRLFQREVGNNIEWLVFFDGYPQPHLQWKKYNYNITTEDNFVVNTTSTFTVLKINSLKLIDAGVYTLVAENQYITRELNFTLKVAEKPISKLVNIKSYYAPNENAEFYCTALSLRTVTFSNVTWNFLKCLDFPLCKNSTIVQLTNVHVMEQEPFMFYKNFTSKIKMPIEISGKITCKTCNAVGCGVSTETVLVSDGIGNFSIIKPDEPVIKGDDIEFICVASVYYFTDKLRWENLNNTLIVESDRLHIRQNKTLFTHRSTVKINNVQKSDAMVYICVGESTSLDTMVDETYKLVVHDPIEPFFYDTNMNQTKVRNIDINIDDVSPNTLILKCFVKGMPTPKVTWFKDNMMLKENNQYSFKFDNQELNIKYLKQNDSGQYFCRATNRFGTVETYQQIRIKNALSFVIIGPTESVIKGDNVKLTCAASVLFYTDTLTWVNTTKTEELRTVSNNTLFFYRSTLKIDNVQESDAKNYTCAGEYMISRDDNTSFIKEIRRYELVVHDPVLPFFYKTNMNETIVKVIELFPESDENVTLQCFAKGMPTPNVTWFKDNTMLKEGNQYSFKFNNQELNIKYLKQNDSGKYLCHAANRFGTNETYQQIRIKIKLSGIKNNFVENFCINNFVDKFYIIGPKEVIKGDDVKLTCFASVTSYTNELTWINLIKTEKLRTVQNNTLSIYQSTLEIDNVQESDAKNYTCAGEYIISNDNNTFFTMKEIRHYELIIYDPVPPFFSKTNMNETKAKDIKFPENHETVTLQCFAKGIPTPNVTWSKDNIELRENDQYSFKSDNQELIIKYFKQNDSGKYFCRATNRFNTTETYQQIIIKNVKSEPKPVEQKPADAILIISISILGIISVILGIFITIKVCREKKLKKELIETGLMNFVDGALECLNPDLTVENQAELLPYDKKWEFPRERLKLGKQLGSGAFGVVMKAEAYGIRENESVTTVAVKMVRRTSDLTYVRALASELKIMIHLGKHLNVVNLLGACTKNIFKRELLVIVEYCCFGNLHNYLFKHRTNYIDQIDSKTGKIAHNVGMDTLTKVASVNSNNSLNSGSDTASHNRSKTININYDETSCMTDGYILSDKASQSDWKSNYCGDCSDQNFKPICTQDLLSWAFQVARGMEYLSQRRVLHGDLAARNILLTEDNVVKICDFGLAKSMYKDDNYKKKSDSPLPIKWMAIESMKDRIFSTQSDIWSFGIMLWEFFSLAETPYPGIEVENLYPKLIEGYRMEQPKYANCEVYDIILQCWKIEPISRPSFTNLVESIGNLIEESVKSHYISLNMPYMDMNTMILESGKTDYLAMMSAPNHAILSSAHQDYVKMKSGQAILEDASNSTYLCTSPDES